MEKVPVFVLILLTFINSRASQNINNDTQKDTTYVEINLTAYVKNKLKITVYAPNIKENNTHFIIPQIIPGTYLKVNYKRFYSKFKAYDKNGTELASYKKGNHYIIKNSKELYKLEYEVKQSQGSRKIWDNILGCAGTIFTEKSFLINYQLITGYFENFKDTPYEIRITKPDILFGSTSLAKKTLSAHLDVYKAKNYAELIDSPLLYAKADTLSFKVSDARFKIAVYSETDKVTAKQIKPNLKKVIENIHSYYGNLPSKNYHFLFYIFNDEEYGVFKNFGASSALEHLSSSVYYLGDYKDGFDKYLSYIATHEYLHTFTPLTIRSNKINNFSFDKPNMSKHLWFYEGFTDYTASLILGKSLKGNLKNDLSQSTQAAKRLKSRSMTESSEDIINQNIFDWFSKIRQISNFYTKGKLISFCLDMELFKRSKGKMRLRDLMLKLQKEYDFDKPFGDDVFLDILVENSYPELKEFMNKYIIGTELVPYQDYFSTIGWNYIEKGSKIPAFGEIYFDYDDTKKKYYLSKTVKKNTCDLQKGDVILNVNGVSINKKNAFKKMFIPFLIPIKNEKINIVIKRKGNRMILKGVANQEVKIRYSAIYNFRNPTKIQIENQKYFLQGN